MERAISAAAKRRPCFRNDIVLFHSSQCVLLREIRVKLHLIHHGLDLDSFAEIRKDVRIEVGHANSFQLSIPVRVLHSPPCAEVILHRLMQQV